MTYTDVSSGVVKEAVCNNSHKKSENSSFLSRTSTFQNFSIIFLKTVLDFQNVWFEDMQPAIAK